MIRSIRRRLAQGTQKFARRFDPLGMEAIHQGNYFRLADETDWLTHTPLASARGGTANYSLLYATLSVLRDDRTERVLELGAGATSNLVGQWSAAGRGESVHIDDDESWLGRSVRTTDDSTAIHAPLVKTVGAGRTIDWYDTAAPSGAFDFLLIDGPQAWSKDTRFNRLGVLEWLPGILDDEFVIVIDDAEREGEDLLGTEILRTLRAGGIDGGSARIGGADSQIVIAGPNREFALYL